MLSRKRSVMTSNRQTACRTHSHSLDITSQLVDINTLCHASLIKHIIQTINPKDNVVLTKPTATSTGGILLAVKVKIVMQHLLPKRLITLLFITI